MKNNDSVCYIAKINKIVPIEGADKIELATVNGWSSIVAKGVHDSDGLLVLCITTDAVIPTHLAEKWGVAQYLRKGNRVRTVKLRGVYSECILISLIDIYPNLGDHFNKAGLLKEGEDLMSDLGIFKYEEPENTHTGLGTGQPRTSKNRINQNFNKYYKFPNIKNVPNMFDEADDVVITRKIHGSNAGYGILKKTSLSLWDRIRRFFGNKLVGYEYVYGSHNVQKLPGAQGFYKTDVWATVAEDNKIKDHLWDIAREFIADNTMGKGIVIFGEIYGPGIQGAQYGYGEDKVEFKAFDIEVDGEYLDREGFEILCPVDTVPVLYKGKWSQEIQDKYVLNQYIDGTKVPHEGVVITSITGDRKKMAKVINPEYHTYAEKHLVPEGH